MIILKSIDNKTPEEGLTDLLQRVYRQLNDSKISDTITDSLLQQTKDHISKRYPGSTHWDPNKVTKDLDGININIPGATRAYHDILIKPKYAQALTIPIHRSAYKQKARSFPDLFIVRKDGKAFLARAAGKNLTFMYVLAKSAFQKQDPSLLPKDEVYAEGIFQRISQELEK